MHFANIARTHVGLRRRLNEDAWLALPDRGLWAVADGMGGHHRGDIASALVIEALGACPTRLSVKDRVAWVRATLQDANRRLVNMAQREDPQRTMGATIVALVADERRFTCLWAGDSRCYLRRGGSLTQLSRDHSLVQQLVDAGEIRPEDADHHPNANVITRAVGAAPTLAIDGVDGTVARGDRFLLASDGLTRLATPAELLQGLAADDLEAAADAFVDRTLERGAPDNLTLVIVGAS